MIEEIEQKWLYIIGESDDWNGVWVPGLMVLKKAAKDDDEPSYRVWMRLGMIVALNRFKALVLWS